MIKTYTQLSWHMELALRGCWWLTGTVWSAYKRRSFAGTFVQCGKVVLKWTQTMQLVISFCQNISGASENKLLFSTKVTYKDNNTSQMKLLTIVGSQNWRYRACGLRVRVARAAQLSILWCSGVHNSLGVKTNGKISGNASRFIINDRTSCWNMNEGFIRTHCRKLWN